MHLNFSFYIIKPIDTSMNIVWNVGTAVWISRPCGKRICRRNAGVPELPLSEGME